MSKLNSVPINDRILPHNEDAERYILGSILLENNTINDVLEYIDETAFYHTGHALIFQTFRELYDKESAIDIVIVTDQLNRLGKLDSVGGAFYLTTLVESVVIPSNVADYARIVRDKYIARRLIQIADEITQMGLNPNIQVDNLVESAEQMIFDIAQSQQSREIHFLGDLVSNALDRIEQIYKKESGYTGLPSGFSSLDNLTGGFQKSDLIIIAARPSVGKTSLALNFAAHISIPTLTKPAQPVLLYSLEMSKEQLIQRLICTEAGVSSKKIREGYLSKRNWEELYEASVKLSKANIYIDDTPGISALELRAKTIRLKSKRPDLSLVIIDYLQLMSGRARLENRQQEISDISRSLKALARELNIPVIALSQLNRQVEMRGKDHMPQLSDLRESGALEQDADVVIFIAQSPKKADEPASVETDNIVKIRVAKQRNGPTDDFELAFIKQYTKFGELYLSSSYNSPPDLPNDDEGDPLS